MSVRFKFKNDLDHHSVPCDGLNISTRDLKRSIIRQKKFGKITDFDLVITNTATGHVYEDENELINKNTTVSVQRAPLADGQKKVWEEDAGIGIESMNNVPTGSVASIINVSTSSGLTEDDRISSMMQSSTELYNEKNWQKYKGQKAFPEGSKPPAVWKCRTCFQNHWASECPFANSDLKRTTGIPRTFLMPSQEKVLGAKIDPQGQIVVNEMELQAYNEKKIEKSPWVADDRPSAPKIEIPEELVCKMCKEILTDAVMLPCCAEATCDDCAREGIISSDNSKCPLCQEQCSPEDVIPYRLFREKVDKFRNQTGYSKQKKPVPSPEKHNNLMEMRPTLPDIVLPDINDAKFNTLINQKGNTEDIKAPNLDFTFTSSKPQSDVILPELFSTQQLFTQNVPPPHGALEAPSNLHHQPPPSPTHQQRELRQPSPSPRQEVEARSSPVTVTIPPSPDPSIRSRSSVTPTPLDRSQDDPISSPTDTSSLLHIQQRIRQEKERFRQETARSRSPPSHIYSSRRSEDRPSPFMDKRSPSPGGGRRTPTRQYSPRRVVSPSAHRSNVVSPTNQHDSRRPLTPTYPRQGLPPHSHAMVSQPLPGHPYPGAMHPAIYSVAGQPPPGYPIAPGSYAHPSGVYIGDAMAGYLPPSSRAEFDPLAEFNKYLKEKKSPPRGGPRSPTRRRSPPRAYRPRPRSREKDRYYVREKERRRTPERYARYKHEASPTRHTRPEHAARSRSPGATGWKDKENTPVESEPRYREEYDEQEQKAKYSSSSRDVQQYDEHTRYRQKETETVAYSRDDRRVRYEEKDRRAKYEDEKRRRDDPREQDKRRDDHERRREDDKRRGTDDRYSSRSKKSEKFIVADGKVDRFGFATRDPRVDYDKLAESRYPAQKTREDEYERDGGEVARSRGGRAHGTPSLSPSPGSGSRLGGVLYEDDVQKERERLSLDKGEGDEKKERKQKKKKKNKDEDADSEDEGKKKKKHKKKKKKRDESSDGKESLDQSKDSVTTPTPTPGLVAYDSQDENKVTSEEKPSDEAVRGGKDVPSDTKDNSDQPSAAENQPSRFKNSFSEVVEEKPTGVVLPTLIFDSTTSQLTAKETVDKAVEPDGRSVKSKSKSGSKNKIVTPPTGTVVESNGRKSAQDGMDVTLRTDLSPSDLMLDSGKDLDLSLSPLVPETQVNREIFEPDNPLVKNDMSPEFKNDLLELKSQLQSNKASLLKRDEDCTKLKVAEPDSTIDTALLAQQAQEQELPSFHSEVKTANSPNILKKALDNIKDNDHKHSKKKKSESNLVEESVHDKSEDKKSKKKKKKGAKKADSEESNSDSEDDEDKKSAKGSNKEDSGDEKGSDNDSDSESEDKKKKKKKKSKKKKKKSEIRKMKEILQHLEPEDLKKLVKKKKKKKKKKKEDSSSGEEDNQVERSVSKEKKRKRSRSRSMESADTRPRKRSSTSSMPRKDSRSRATTQSLSPSPPVEQYKSRGYKIRSRSRTHESIEVLEPKKSVKDRLGKRRVITEGDGERGGSRRRKMSADREDDERLVKVEGAKFTVHVENRTGPVKDDRKGKLASVVQKRIDKKKDRRSRSRSRDRNRDSQERYRRNRR